MSLLISTGSEEWVSSDSLSSNICLSLDGDVRLLEGRRQEGDHVFKLDRSKLLKVSRSAMGGHENVLSPLKLSLIRNVTISIVSLQFW